jgi:Hormone-sensitive lipase (HSL) N-terminus
MAAETDGSDGGEVRFQYTSRPVSAGDRTPSESTLSADEDYRRDLLTLFRELRSFAFSIVEYYKECGSRRDADPSRRRMHSAASRLHDHIDHGIQPGVEYLLSIAYLYDLDDSTRANGYRSFILVVERCCQRLLALTR